MVLSPGSYFRAWLVHSLLGEGGMGAAYLASHPILRTPLVIKTFKAAPTRELFREAHLAARVRSPHVVGVWDAGVEQGVPFVVQPYVDGVDLGELLGAFVRLGRPLSAGRVAALLVDVARGLHSIHQAGVVHRDIKPENLFLSGDGGAQVGDFGIALDPLQEQKARMSGTPLFMAPEQWAQAPIDRRADLYALGATGHLLAVGAPPFQAESVIELSGMHLLTPYVPPAALGPRDAFLFAVLARLLQKDRAARYPTAEALAVELSTIAAPPPAWTQLGPDVAEVGGLRVLLSQGDLATRSADVIVNAANFAMRMRAGVSGALRKAGGGLIEEEAVALAPPPVVMGRVVWTGAGSLSARYVAHAVAALDGAICIQRCWLRILLEAEARGLSRIAAPALGTGSGEVPAALGATLTLEALRTFAGLLPERVRDVEIVLFDAASLRTWREILASMR